MRKLLIVLCLVSSIAALVFAQETPDRNPDYEQFLRYMPIGGEAHFYRVNTEFHRVRVCESVPLDEYRHATLLTVLAEMATVIPTEFTTDTGNCDIFISIVPDVPQACSAYGSSVLGCTGINWTGYERYYYPVEIGILAYGYTTGVILHELMHAYGVWNHIPYEFCESAVNPYVNLRRVRLTQCDINLLTYLYSQLVFSDAERLGIASVTEAYDRRWCDSVEAMFRQHRINWTEYERFRCG